MGGDQEFFLARCSSFPAYVGILFSIQDKIYSETGLRSQTGVLVLSPREAQVYSGAYQTFSAPLSLPSHRQTIPEIPATTLPLFGAASDLFIVASLLALGHPKQVRQGQS